MKIFYPLVIVINFVSKSLLGLFGVRSEYVNQELLTKDEIKFIVKESSDRREDVKKAQVGFKAVVIRPGQEER